MRAQLSPRMLYSTRPLFRVCIRPDLLRSRPGKFPRSLCGTTEETRALIDWRTANEGLFTGRRNSSKNGWEDFVTSSGLSISARQAKKKWQNLVQKYKELRDPPTGKGVEAGGVTAANWQWYAVLDAALQGQHSISPPLVVASSAATAGGVVTPPASVAETAEASEASADQGPEGSREGRDSLKESLF
ncbi:hypothetical protein WMY93_026335 [Mugilogobius chulae]|uniref:Myb/SANT-like DNA-binding domain-containing protein n=1 Tax=Mugilogobius chulae TaxID=88201 RepID=A0AAW0N0L8_9GOBI